MVKWLIRNINIAMTTLKNVLFWKNLYTPPLPASIFPSPLIFENYNPLRLHSKISRIWIFLNSLYQGLFLFLRFLVTGPINVPFRFPLTPFSGPFCLRERAPWSRGCIISFPKLIFRILLLLAIINQKYVYVILI